MAAICARLRGAGEEERQRVVKAERKLRDRNPRNPLSPLIEDEWAVGSLLSRTFNLERSFVWQTFDVIWTVRCNLVRLI